MCVQVNLFDLAMFAKLRGLCDLRGLHDLVPHMSHALYAPLAWSRASYVSRVSCSCASQSPCWFCFYAARTSCSTCSWASCASYLVWSHVSCASCTTCSRVSHTTRVLCSACSRALCAPCASCLRYFMCQYHLFCSFFACFKWPFPIYFQLVNCLK